MANNNYRNFLIVWDNAAFIGVFLTLAMAIGIIIFYSIRQTAISDLKRRYDFVRENEIKWYFLSIISFGTAVFLFVNTMNETTVATSVTLFFIRLFLSICAFTLVVYISHLLLKYAYPGFLEQKLRKLRYTPRISPQTNRKMKLLTEDEEDVHLDEGMQAEENVFSIDYDVWVDEETGLVKIEKYPGRLQALKCNSCGFQTMKIVKEEIITQPTYETEGELIKYHECAFCKVKRRKAVKIAPLLKSDSEYVLPEIYRFRDEKKVEAVTVQIHTNLGEIKTYEFHSVHQAKKFLAEFEMEDVTY